MLHVTSEIAPLEAVIVHRPGPEIEQVIPSEAHASLFDDILYLPNAKAEHDQLVAALSPFATVYEVQTLLAELLADGEARHALLTALVAHYACPQRFDELNELPSDLLAERLIVGLPAQRGLLEPLDDHIIYDLPPLPNLYFTRDAAMAVGKQAVIGAMASRARAGEALLYRALFQHHPALANEGLLLDGSADHPRALRIEGGDVLVLRDDLLLIGVGERTSPAGIERLAQSLAGSPFRQIVIQPIPRARASIHLDMLFTMLDEGVAAVHLPAITGRDARPAWLLTLDGAAPHLEERGPLLALLEEMGIVHEVIPTGGRDPRTQAREQWQKGTNFFAMAPGKIVGYGRNEESYRELEAHGFRVVSGAELLRESSALTAPGRVAVAIASGELSRGGGGARCMTLPIRRASG